MRRILSTAACTSFALMLACEHGLGASVPDKIKFPYSPMSWNNLPWWVAKEAGHFERNELDVQLLYEGASSVIVQAMLASEANFGGLAGPAVVSNVITGGDVIQIAAIVKTFTVPMFSAPNIKDVAQLKGQKVESDVQEDRLFGEKLGKMEKLEWKNWGKILVDTGAWLDFSKISF